MGHLQYDYNKRPIALSLITINASYCILFTQVIIIKDGCDAFLRLKTLRHGFTVLSLNA